MSGRSTRRRSKTARALAAEEQAEAERQEKAKVSGSSSSSKKKKSRPKSRGGGGEATSNGPASVDRSVTPSSRSSSRATSPASNSAVSLRSSSRRRSSTQRSAAAAATAAVTAASRRGASGSNTPISRASRSSSVASNGGTKTVPKLKIKTKLGRGYNPSLVNYKDSEYHYGSDFEDDDDDLAEAVESEKSSESSDDDVGDADSDDLKVESDVDLDELVPSHSLPQTPVPFWLREDEAIPPLVLPESSQDLLVPTKHILQVFSIYEVLRRYSQILRLTPFRVEDFCAALSSDEQSNLLSEVHIALLKAIIRSEETTSTFGPMDQKDSINCVIYFTDSVTWPETLRMFLQSDASYEEPLKILQTCDYPFADSSEAMLNNRVQVLSFLCDQILSTQAIRDFIVDDGQLGTEEHCRVCHRLGEMLVCDSCPGVYHLGCLDPPLHDVPEDEWRCYVCQANEVDGVVDCAKAGNGNACRQETLGIDRGGNKYWFLCRRLVVEVADGKGEDGNVRYYSTVKQLEELSEVLDDEMYEKELWENMEAVRIEMERQMDITEGITMAKKPPSKKSYFEVENGKI